MIPFDEIDARLQGIGKNRAWLAQESGRKINSIRVALAPGAVKKNRNDMLQKALSDVIEREEAIRREPLPIRLPTMITLEPKKEEYTAWDKASRSVNAPTLEEWAIASLNAAAARWFSEQGRGPALPDIGSRLSSVLNEEPENKPAKEA